MCDLRDDSPDRRKTKGSRKRRADAIELLTETNECRNDSAQESEDEQIRRTVGASVSSPSSSPSSSTSTSETNTGRASNTSMEDNESGESLERTSSSSTALSEHIDEPNLSPVPSPVAPAEQLQPNVGIGMPQGENIGQDDLDNADLINNPLAEDANDSASDGHSADTDEDEINMSSDEDTESEDEGDDIQNLDPPLYENAPLSLGQSLIAILSFCIAHHLTGVGLADLLQLIALHCMGGNNCIKSLYKFKKYFKKINSPIKLHYFCSNCFLSLPSKNSRCENVNCVDSCDVSYFLQVSLIHQLECMFKRPNFRNNLLYRHNRKKKNDNNYEDIFDGSLYQKESKPNEFLYGQNSISFLWNTDGVSVHRSNKLSLWPFYLVINELPYSQRFKKENVLIAGLWFGPTKPKLPLFVRSFHDDLTKIYDGIDLKAEDNSIHRIRGKILCGTCDLPAKAHFLNIKQYNGYFGCSKCMVRGERSERTNDQHSYPYGRYQKRTAEQTDRYAQQAEEHKTAIFGIKGISALKLYVSDYLCTTAVDSMHSCFEGLSKRLCELWFDVSFRGEDFTLYPLSKTVSNYLITLTPPSYIKRMPRTVTDHLAVWKASEFKNWLFYYSVPILSQFMSREYFNHYLLLVHALSMLYSDSVSEEMIVEAELCLNEFVLKFEDLYGLQYCSMNVHLLLHLADDVRAFGPLWTMSCMPLEDLNGQLKLLVHGTRHVALQITSSLSQTINLPTMIAQLPPDNNARRFCENVVNKTRLKITEAIDNNLWSVGKYVKLARPPAVVEGALIEAAANGNVTLFYRLKRGRILYSSESYELHTKTSSTTVKYASNDGNHKFGIIYTFTRVSECDCDTHACRCAAAFYAIITPVETRSAFTIAYPHVSVVNIMLSAGRREDAIAIPLSQIKTLCFSFEVNNIKYIVNPVNTLELE